ncbi:MAG: UDP-N-acetylmuramoyl-L-alanyl-D-glutamate--2,6-diaminopimelate ligase, partial [Candidatus Paceibacteria bacterium]
MLATLVKRLGGECTLDGSETAILGVTLDSRAVREGDLFVALKGLTGDGRAYIPQAVAAGAGAILQESGSVSAASIAVPVWVHSDARRLAGEIASEVFGNPSEQMDVFAITGTNGKTTTAHLIAELLRSTGAKPAVLGTTGFHLAQGVTLEATHTTPDAPELHRLLKQHRELGGDSVVLEVSSHALSQCRTAGLGIDFGIYTNLSRDHLDYHGDMQQYAVTKSLMFSSLQSSAVAILNRDDSWFEMMAGAAAESGARVVTYSAEGPADLQASELVFDTDVTYLTLSGMGISLTRLRIPLSGRFNVSNVLAASAAVLLRGASPAAVVAGLASISSPSGRLQ